MKTNKFCCRIFPVLLIILSVVIASGIWYFDEGKHSFSFLINRGDIFNFLGTVLFIAIVPIGIFYLATERKRLEQHAKKLAMLGFLPSLVLLLILIL